MAAEGGIFGTGWGNDWVLVQCIGLQREGGDILKKDLLLELGYGGGAAGYEAALEEAGLSNPRKARIAAGKRVQIEAVLAARFIRVCNRGDCRAKAAGIAAGRAVCLASTQSDCEVCSGSENQTAVDEMVAAFEKAGWRRLCVVGGSASTWENLEQCIEGRLELRLVDGKRSRQLRLAHADEAWADLVVIWAGTELDHKVSEQYRGKNRVTAPGRGVATLAKAARESARRAIEAGRK